MVRFRVSLGLKFRSGLGLGPEERVGESGDHGQSS